MELRFYIRQYQNINYLGVPVVYNGSTPASLKATQGTVDNVWHDFTEYCINLDKLKLQWAIDRSGTGEVVAGAIQPKKSASGNITIDGKAYDYVKAWLVDHIAAPLHSIECKIEDTSCGFYESYQFKATQLSWCEMRSCEFDLNLKQKDDAYTCIQKTLISDNWQGWFGWGGAKTKKHPRFSYCNEKRPNGTLVVLWWLIGMMEIVFAPLIAIVILIIDAVLSIYYFVAQLASWISFGSISGPSWSYIDPSAAFDYCNNLLLESCGCGREHPAPLIRDYISNVCDRCGIRVDANSAPIFFAQNISMTTSSGYINNVPNPHYMACYFYAPYHRGIRRFKTLNLFTGVDLNTEDYYIPDNSPLLTLDMLLDQLKAIYNAEWRIKNGTLYFQRKDWFTNGAFLYDFTANSPDRDNILEGVCFEWSEVKQPAYIQGLFAKDAIDSCGNEVLNYVNGIANFDVDDSNPILEDKVDKTSSNFGGAKFRLDGAATDYIYDAIQVVANGSVLAPPLVRVFKDFDSACAQYINYALLLRDENCEKAKILIWDGVSYDNAKCYRDVVPVNNNLVPAPSNPVPDINTAYPFYDSSNNPYWQTWINKHPAFTDVKGAALTPSSSATGVYEARNYFGSLILHNAARLVNYPMYFEPHYKGTLWDWFHFIDDPRRNPQMNMSWNLKIELCCDDLKKLKVLGDASGIELLTKVKLPFQYYPEGLITEIEVSYDSSDEKGKYIMLRGRM